MRILAFAASSSRQSINKRLVEYAARLLPQFHTPLVIEVLDLNAYEMPIYSIDREKESGIPEAAHRFYEKIKATDALIISYAEHNGFYTAAYKNIFDWASRIEMKVYQNKPMVVFATSTGKGGGANVLKTALDSAPHFGAVIKASLSVPSFRESFDLSQGKISDPALESAFVSALKHLF